MAEFLEVQLEEGEGIVNGGREVPDGDDESGRKDCHETEAVKKELAVGAEEVAQQQRQDETGTEGKGDDPINARLEESFGAQAPSPSESVVKNEEPPPGLTSENGESASENGNEAGEESEEDGVDDGGGGGGSGEESVKSPPRYENGDNDNEMAEDADEDCDETDMSQFLQMDDCVILEEGDECLNFDTEKTDEERLTTARPAVTFERTLERNGVRYPPLPPFARGGKPWKIVLGGGGSSKGGGGRSGGEPGEGKVVWRRRATSPPDRNGKEKGDCVWCRGVCPPNECAKCQKFEVDGKNHYSCLICGKTMRHGGNFKQHVRSHATYRCEVCGVSIQFFKELVEHRAEHEKFPNVMLTAKKVASEKNVAGDGDDDSAELVKNEEEDGDEEEAAEDGPDEEEDGNEKEEGAVRRRSDVALNLVKDEAGAESGRRDAEVVKMEGDGPEDQEEEEEGDEDDDYGGHGMMLPVEVVYNNSSEANDNNNNIDGNGESDEQVVVGYQGVRRRNADGYPVIETYSNGIEIVPIMSCAAPSPTKKVVVAPASVSAGSVSGGGGSPPKIPDKMKAGDTCQFCYSVVKPNMTRCSRCSAVKLDEKTTQYTCLLCRKVIINHAGNFKQHVRSHGNKQFKCEMCGKKFTTAAKLLKHADAERAANKSGPGAVSTAASPSNEGGNNDEVKKRKYSTSGIKRFSCDSCEKSFKTMQERKVHQRRAHTEPAAAPPAARSPAADELTYECRLCKAHFTAISDLSAHKCGKDVTAAYGVPDAVHLGAGAEEGVGAVDRADDRPQPMEIVAPTPSPAIEVVVRKGGSPQTNSPSRTASSSSLSGSPRGIYNCDQCKKTFTYRGNLEAHMRTHMDDKPFRCSTCGKAFATANSMKAHQRVAHTLPTQTYYCEFCPKTFNYPNHYKTHMRVHTGGDARPYNCIKCNRSFTQPTSLRTHLRVVHNLIADVQKVAPAGAENAEAGSGGVVVAAGGKRVRGDRRNLDGDNSDGGKIKKKLKRKRKDADAGDAAQLEWNEAAAAAAAMYEQQEEIVCETCNTHFTHYEFLDSHLCIHSMTR